MRFRFKSPGRAGAQVAASKAEATGLRALDAPVSGSGGEAFALTGTGVHDFFAMPTRLDGRGRA